MSAFTLTIVLTFVLIVLALAFLGVTWLLKGKSSLRAGSCGRFPSHKKDDSCGKDITCELCKGDKQINHKEHKEHKENKK